MLSANPYLKIQYEQLWEHARHQELQRLHFTSIYAIIVAGVLASVLLRGDSPNFSFLLYFFLAILSLFGLYMTDAWNKSFASYRELIKGINSIWELPNEPDYREWRFPAYKTFLLFYSLTSGFFSILVFIELLSILGYTLNYYGYGIFLIIWLTITNFFYYQKIDRSEKFRKYILKRIQVTLDLPIEWINRKEPTLEELEKPDKEKSEKNLQNISTMVSENKKEK
jgi:hypothetical protein